MASGDCEDALHRLYHYLDEELNDDVRAKIAKHLVDCPPCGDAFNFEVELRRLIASKCREQAPEGLRRRIADAIGHPFPGGPVSPPPPLSI